MGGGDPFYNINLSYVHEDFRIANSFPQKNLQN